MVWFGFLMGAVKYRQLKCQGASQICHLPPRHEGSCSRAEPSSHLRQKKAGSGAAATALAEICNVCTEEAAPTCEGPSWMAANTSSPLTSSPRLQGLLIKQPVLGVGHPGNLSRFKTPVL